MAVKLLARNAWWYGIALGNIAYAQDSVLSMQPCFGASNGVVLLHFWIFDALSETSLHM